MGFLDLLVRQVPEGKVLDVCVGLHWIAVKVDVDGELRCGLASTVPAAHGHTPDPDVPGAGRLDEMRTGPLVDMASSRNTVQAGIGLATINALLSRHPETWREENGEDMIAALGSEKTVALVGSFPFAARLRERVGRLTVLDQQPKADELPAEAAPEVLPNADIIAITSMTLINQTLDGLLSLRNEHAKVLLLGPSTPLSETLFSKGIDVLSGAVVTDIDDVFAAVRQGANFRQVHRAGVRLVTVMAP